LDFFLRLKYSEGKKKCKAQGKTQSMFNSCGPFLCGAKCWSEAGLALQRRRFWNGLRPPKAVMFSLGALQTQINPEIKHAVSCVNPKYVRFFHY